MFNQSGRLVKKKKTTIQFNTKDPVFNETLNFEVSAHQLDSSRFLITLCSRRPELDMMVMEDIALQDSSDQDNSAYYFEGLGFIILQNKRTDKNVIKFLYHGIVYCPQMILSKRQ